MWKIFPVVLFGIMTIQFIRISETSPGEWIEVAIPKDGFHDFSRNGWSPKNQRSTIFYLKACGETVISLNVDAATYVKMYLGNTNNTYILGIPNSVCDETGACNITSYAQYQLACDLEYFYLTWDMDGNVSFSNSAQIILTIYGQGLREEANYLTIHSLHQDGASIYLYKDYPPQFVAPAPDGTTSVTLEETASPYLLVYSITTTDPEGDSVVALVWDFTDLFTFNGTDLYTLKPLDYEAACVYVLTIGIHDTNANNMVNTSLTIRLEDVHDETPSVDAVSVSLPEEIGVGSYIDGGFTVSDLDAGDQLKYALSGAHASYFEITVDGRLKIAARIDFDPPNNLHLLDDVTLTVTDLGSNTNSTPLTFIVTDINDNSPAWNSNMYYVDVTENELSGVLLSSFVVTDDDDADNGQTEISIVDGDDASPKFAISGTDLVTTSDPIDYEDLATSSFKYRLTLQAVDKPSDVVQPVRTSFATVIVTVLPVNEHTPTMTPAPTGLSRSETAAPGDIIHTYVASDGDLGVDGDLAYLLVSVLDDSGTNRDDAIYVDAGKGNVVISSSRDYDTTTGGYGYLDITVQVEDLGMTSLSSQDTFRLEILPENDNPPVFSDVLYQTVVVEGTPIGTTVLAAAATDADGDTLTYSIVDEATFGYTSAITLLKELDFEDKRCYTFLLRASDGLRDVVVPVTMNVSNIIDEFPVITVHNPLTLIEELPVGTPLGDLYDVTDIDVDDTLTFSLEGTESSYFKIDAVTGLISVDQRMDRDAGLVVLSQVTLKVTDSNGNSDSETLAFDIIDINDNSPVFGDDILFLTVPENTVQDTILSAINAQDDDDGDNSNIVFSIASGDDSNPNEKFQLAGSDLKTTATVIDYESLETSNFQYTLFIHAVDQPLTEAKKTSVAVVVITVEPENEFSPVFIAPNTQGRTLSELTLPGTLVETFKATDDDVGDDGDVVYSIANITAIGAGDVSSAMSMFYMEVTSGRLLVENYLDFDLGVSSYEITVQATDMCLKQNKSTEMVYTITLENVNDNPPVVMHEDIIDVVENAEIGDVIMTLSTQDYDADPVNAIIVDGDMSMFSVDSGSGIILQQELDYESSAGHVITVSFSDGVHVVNETLTFRVLDVIDETPILEAHSHVTIPEELPAGTVVDGLYHVTDLDRGDALNFSLTGTDSQYFSINKTTGQITLAQRIDFDYPTRVTSLAQLTLTVTDMAGLMATESLHVEITGVNDGYPQFSQSLYRVNISENSSTERLLDLTCMDADEGPSGDIVMKILNGDDPGLSKFYLTGTELSALGADLDYEALESTQYTYSMTVTAVDSPLVEAPKTGVALVVVTVLPVNEHSPMFTNPPVDSSGYFPEISAPEGTPVDAALLTIQATDLDLGLDGEVEYFITSIISDSGINSTGIFTIDSSSGNLYVSDHLDADEMTGGVNFYILNITATDSGLPPLSTQGALLVNVTGINDNTPMWLTTTTEIGVSDSDAIGDELLSLSASDVDGDELTFNTSDPMFKTDGASLKLHQTPDTTLDDRRTILLSVTDGEFTMYKALTVVFHRPQNQAPIITGDTTISIPEELPVGTALPRSYSVFDPDDFNSLTYFLAGEDTDYISIDPISGSLVLIARLDRDGPSGVTSIDDLTLTVTDATGQNVSVDLNITVLDINDNPPLCDTIDDIKISENVPEDVFVANISCNDSDSDGEDAVDVYLMSSADPPRFKVSGHQLFTGQEALDYESTSDWLIINMIAVDNPGGDVRLSSTLALFVKVLPVNEYEPEWKVVDENGNGRFPDVSISENELPGYKVTNVSATDKDHGEDGHVTYSIDSIESDTGVRMDNIFTINPNTGELTTSSQLDSDPSTGGVSWFDITVSAADSFSSSSRRSISAVQRVLLENHNDLAPVFSQQVSRVDVSCGTLAASPLLSLSAGDGDSASVEYSLQTGPDPFIRVDVTGDVILLDYPDGSDVSALAQSVVVEATDEGSPEMKGTCTLLVLFEKCLSSTSNSTSTTVMTEPTTTASATPPPWNCTESGPPVEEFVEAWAMRGLVMLLSAALLGAAVMHLRPKVPSPDKLQTTMEARQKPFDRKTTVLSFSDF